MRAGTRHLGLSVEWRYQFVASGSTFAPTRDAVFLDVGGQLCPGVIDQHQDGSVGRSTTELVFRNPELVYGHLMNAWLDRRDRGQDLRGAAFSPVLVTHTDPDFDALVATWLVRRLIEEGDLPPEAEALANYSAIADQGKYAVDLDHPETATHAIHIAYLALQRLAEGDVNALARGHDLLDAVLGAIRRERTHLFGLSAADLVPPSMRPAALRDSPVARAVTEWRQLDRFADVVALLDVDLEKFAGDEANATIVDVVLPAADGGAGIPTRGFLAGASMECALNKYWVRARGFPYLVCPSGRPVGGVYPRVILSLDPNWVDPAGRAPTLRGLGFRLEQAEVQVRAGKPALDRGRPPRWPDGTCDNADPWYDGRGHGYTIVDSPRVGTVLPYADVCRLATSRFWEMRLDEAEVYVAIPDPGLPPRARGPPPRCPPLTTRAMRAWFDDSCEIAAPAGPLWFPEPPRGIHIDWHHIRTFPAQTSPPFHILKVSLSAEGAATLDELAAWLTRINAEHQGQAYAVARVIFEPGASADSEAERLLARLCAASGSVHEGDREVVLYNGHVIALSGRRSAPTSLQSGLLLELMLYAAFQSAALQAFAARIHGLVASGRLQGGEALRREFLVFHAKYVHHEVAVFGGPREVYNGLRGALGLAEQFSKTTADLDGLAALEREVGERRSTTLLFFLGLTGIVEAGSAAFTDVPTWQNATVAALVVLAISVYAYLNRRGRHG